MKHLVLMVAMLVGVIGKATAQNGYTQYRLKGLQQSNALNPAFVPDAKVQVGLPGLSGIDVRAANNGFALSDLVKVRSDDSLSLDVDGMIQRLKAKNVISVDARVELFSFGLGGKFGYFNVSVSERVHARIGYPRDLIRLGWQGNGGDLLGERAALDGFGVDAAAFREYAAGYAYSFSDRLTAGMRIKYLHGHFNAHTRTSRFGMHTDATTYDLSFDGEGLVQSSGIQEVVENADFDPMDLMRDRGNRGMGVDLGVDWQYSERLHFSASLLDLGRMTWRHNTRSYSAEPFAYTFSGVNINQFLNDTTDFAQTMLDSLASIVVFGEQTGTYHTRLNPRLFASATYSLNEWLSTGVLFHGELYKERILPTVALSIDADLGRWFGATLNWAYANRSFANLGAGFRIHGGPVQFYMVADNLLAGIVTQHVRGLQVMFGINLAFGRRE